LATLGSCSPRWSNYYRSEERINRTECHIGSGADGGQGLVLVLVELVGAGQSLVEVDPVGGHTEPGWRDAWLLVDLGSCSAVVGGGALLRGRVSCEAGADRIDAEAVGADDPLDPRLRLSAAFTELALVV
jgi:hypothetical protein